MKKLKRREAGQGMTELIEALKKVSTKTPSVAKLNEVSMEDGEGRRIYYFITKGGIKKRR